MNKLKDIYKELKKFSWVKTNDQWDYIVFNGKKYSLDSPTENLYEVVKQYNKTLTLSKVDRLKVLYNVRKQQYYANPTKYPFGLNEFCKTVFMSGWNFDGTPQENLALEFASTPKERGRIKVDQTVRYARETDMYKNIQQVKLAKTLRRVYEQKTLK